MSASHFFVAVRCEWRMLWRDAGAWIALAAIVVGVFFALHNGAARVAVQRAAIEAARADETRRIAALRKTLTDLDAGHVGEALSPYRDPRNPVFVGAGLAAPVAVLAPAALAIAATGQSDLYPAAIKVTTGNKENFLFSDEIENPVHLEAGSVDLAFVLVFLYPLAVLALCYDLISDERERGTLALTLASARDPRRVFAGKLFARAGAPILATLVVALAGVAVYAGPGAIVTAGCALLAAAILLYGAFWALLAAAVNGLRRSSAHNALILVGVWAAATLIVPAAINAGAGAAYPAPSRAETILAARAASIDADRERDAALARYMDEHRSAANPEDARGGARERSARRLAVQEAAFERVETVAAAHDAALARQHVLADRLSLLSPALLTYRVVVEAAGADEIRYAAFLARIDAFHREWRAFFLERAHSGAPLTAQDYGSLPIFAIGEGLDSANHSAFATFIAGVAPLTLLLAYFAWRGFLGGKGR